MFRRRALFGVPKFSETSRKSHERLRGASYSHKISLSKICLANHELNQMLKENDILFQMFFSFIKPDQLTKICLKRVRRVMTNGFRLFS